MLTDAEFAHAFPGQLPRPCVPELFAAADYDRRQFLAQRAAYYRQVRADRRAHSMRQLASLWPVAVGMLLGAYALELRELVTCYAPWAMSAVFPFVVLANRLQIPVGGAGARFLPLLMLYAQFPLEGLLVRILLRRRVTLSGVCGRVSCLHILALAQLWLVSGPLSQVLAR